MESYFNGDEISLLFQKRPIYRDKLSEKRLCVYYNNKGEEKDFIRLKIKGVDSAIIFKGFIDREMVLKQGMVQNR